MEWSAFGVKDPFFCYEKITLSKMWNIKNHDAFGFVSPIDLSKNAMVSEVKGHLKEVNCGECSYKTPNIFLSTGTDGRVKVWDLNVMKCIIEMPACNTSCH